MLQPSADAEALRAWAQTEESLRAMRLPEEEIRAARPPASASSKPLLKLWKGHRKVFDVFSAMATQWRTVGTPMGFHYVGLDLTALPVIEQRLGLQGPLDAYEMQLLRVMEVAGKGYLNE